VIEMLITAGGDIDAVDWVSLNSIMLKHGCKSYMTYKARLVWKM